MNLESKIEYYNIYYEINGLPDGFSPNDFFDLIFLDYLLSNEYGFIKICINDLIILLNNDNIFDKLVNLLFNYYWLNINSDNFFNLIINNKSLYNYIANSIINNEISTVFFKYLRSKNSLNLFKSIAYKNTSFFVKIFSYVKTNDLKEMLLDPLWKNIYIQIDYNLFFSQIQKIGADTIGLSYVEQKINSLECYQVIDLLINEYDIVTNQPSYLYNVYLKYEKEVSREKTGLFLSKINENSDEEFLREARNIINNDFGIEVLLSSFKIKQFDLIVKKLELSIDMYEKRKQCFIYMLKNYKDYDPLTVKNVFSLYLFEDILSNTLINISVILKYANQNEKARKILGDLYYGFEQIYYYLNEKNEINPIDIINNTNIKEDTIDTILSKMYELFNEEVNQKTDSKIILKNATVENKQGVQVYRLDNANDSVFLVHSLSELEEFDYEEFIKKSKDDAKICMSLLDSNHLKTFLGGIVFGYLNMPNKLYSATVYDGQTNQRNLLLRQYNSDLTSIESFLNNTNQDYYNELAYLSDNKPIKPSFILCVDREPNDLEIKTAKNFDIPIYIYLKRKEIVKLSNDSVTHQNYDYETFRIKIIKTEKLALEEKTTVDMDEDNFVI